MVADISTKGYLLIADISGYTSLLTTTEIQHASDIIKSLLGNIYEHIKKPFELVKYEGDAILYYIESDTIGEGGKIVDHVEGVYYDFQRQLKIMDLNTTCKCKACAAISNLNLKFFVNYGDFLKQKLPGAGTDLAGSNVILLHRLLKNKVFETFKAKGYVLLTNFCLQKESIPTNALAHREHYEDVGDLDCLFVNLEENYNQKQKEEQKYFEANESDFVHEDSFAYSPEVLWNYCVDGDLRLKWQGNLRKVNNIKNKQNRMGIGSESHCVHGGYKRNSLVVDSRPFQYFIVVSRHIPSFLIPPMKVQYTMIPKSSKETLFSIRIVLLRRDWMTLFFAKLLIPKVLKMEMNFERLHKVLNESIKE